MDLLGKLAGRRDDEDARNPAWSVEQPVEDGEDKGGSLACARLRGADDIAPAQGSRNCRFLDRCRGLIPRVFDSLH